MFQFKLTQREICYKEAHSREWHTFCYQKFKNMETTRLPSNKLERNNQNHLKPPKPSTIEPNIKKKKERKFPSPFLWGKRNQVSFRLFFFSPKNPGSKREKKEETFCGCWEDGGCWGWGRGSEWRYFVLSSEAWHSPWKAPIRSHSLALTSETPSLGPFFIFFFFFFFLIFQRNKT